MDLRPSSLNSSFNYAFTYDVFLSFRGSDTRHGFTGNLYKALCDKGIRAFIDDENLQRGDEITPSLMEAIEKSRIAIPVFSINYASSSFCLDELVNIMKRKDIILVLPIFYYVDPSHVRHQKGSYREALTNHEKKLKANKEKLEEWKMALHQAANLSGYHFEHGKEYEYECIRKIVRLVSSKINRTPLHVADYPVGLESQIREVKKLLDIQPDRGANMVGIHGHGGIGKTTLAIALYNLIADHFDGFCFLQDVRENSKNHGLQHLQSVFLEKIFGENEFNLAGVNEGISILQHRLQQKKVLLILDDVDKQKQLQAIAGRPDWFGLGSIVIITTRDKQLLVSHKVDKTYEMKALDNKDALDLLRWKAFGPEQVDPSYLDVLHRAVTYASGLPLALEVIGSSLYGKSIEEWDSALKQYAKIPNDKILEICKRSYDALEEEEKSVFLEGACCFKGYEIELNEEEEDPNIVGKIELLKSNHPKIEPSSSRNFVYSKSQTQTSRSNLQPLISKSTSCNEKTPHDQLLMALENDDELCFHSTTLNELSKKLQDDSVNKIGLHGKRGSGKTTLVEAVCDKANSLKIFDAVLFAIVSQHPDEWNIQKQFSESLNVNLVREGGYGRASEIKLTLANKERILVILDDVPANFDPEKYMGIPCNDKRCKFLMTTRSENCNLVLGKKEIRCQNMIPMRPLSPEDAWRLLQQLSGIEEEKDDDDDEESSSNLSTMAKEIAFKYKWFPGTIKEIGSSLKDKPLEEWEGLLDSLKHSKVCYQIFLSFRGIDTRDHFTSTLYAELKRNGFKTFMDDKLKDGDQISIELVKAIENSRLSIIILSENYADSAWCLEELVHILKCKETKKQLVWPIFYKVEPTDIRHQTNRVGIAMAKLEDKFKTDPVKIKKWKDALLAVCQLTGRTYRQGMLQPKFIQEIIEKAKESKNYLYIRSMDMD